MSNIIHQKKKKILIEALVSSFVVAFAFAAILPKVFAETSYYFPNAEVELDGTSAGSVTISLNSLEADEIFSIEGNFQTVDDSGNFTLTALSPAGGISPSSNVVSDGRILWQDSTYENPLVLGARESMWSATYSVDKDTPADVYPVCITKTRISADSVDFATINYGKICADVTVTRTDATPSKLPQNVTLKDGEGHDITGTTIEKFYGDEPFEVTWEHTVGDGEISYHPDDDEHSEHVARTAGSNIEIDNVGTVDICAWASETEDYAAAQACITVNVSRRPLDIVGASIADKTYDGTTNATVTSVTFEDRNLNSEDYIATATFEDADAGENVEVHVSVELTESAAANYVLNASNYNTTKTINRYLLHAGDMSILGGSTQAYTPGGVEPDVLVSANTHGGTTTLGEDDYDLEYIDNTSVGSATIRVTGKGNFTTGDGPVILDFNIVARGINLGNLVAPNTIVEGRILSENDIDINVDGVDLVRCVNSDDTNCDYVLEITGDNDGFVGSVINVAAEGRNNYTGVASKDIEVVAKLDQTVSFGGVTGDIEKVYGDARFTYGATTTGDGTITYVSSNLPVATVDLNSGEVTIVGVGVVDIIATAAETDTYAQASAGYRINVSKKTVTISSVTVSNKTYDGSTDATVTDAALSDDDLLVGDGFSIDDAHFTSVNVGSYDDVYVRIKLDDDAYEYYQFEGNTTTAETVGSATINAFTLSADNSTSALASTAYTYDGNVKEPVTSVSVDLDCDGTKEIDLVVGTDYEVAYNGNTNVGAATATITGKGNYTGSLPALEFTISAFTLNADNSTASLANTTFEYDGNAKEPTANVMVDLDGDGTKETTLTAGTDYEISYSDNINAGTATATITAKGNYAGSFTALEFTISKTDSGEPEDTPSDLAGEVGQTLADLGDLPTGFAWVDPTTPVSAGMNDYPATYIKDGDATNYNSTSVSVPVLGYTEEYEVIRGGGKEHIIGVDGNAEFEIDAEYSLFETGGSVYVDNTLVEPAKYESWSSSTVISLSKEYLDSLSLGEHTLAVLFSDGGVARASFIVSEPEPEPGTADTGVFTGVAGGAIATGFSTLALGTLISVAYWIRRRNNR